MKYKDNENPIEEVTCVPMSNLNTKILITAKKSIGSIRKLITLEELSKLVQTHVAKCPEFIEILMNSAK